MRILPLREDRLRLVAKSPIDARLRVEPPPPQWVEWPELGVRIKLYEVREDGTVTFPFATLLATLRGSSNFVFREELKGAGLELDSPLVIAEGAD